MIWKFVIVKDPSRTYISGWLFYSSEDSSTQSFQYDMNEYNTGYVCLTYYSITQKNHELVSSC